MDNSIESEIISTVQHLNSLITMYVLITNPPVDAYYSDLCGRLERFASIIESKTIYFENGFLDNGKLKIGIHVTLRKN